jgi:TRAP-type C4-dicarboxylate transport system substrate-binding protein
MGGRVLSLANQYPGRAGVPELLAFVAEVEARSGGELRVAVVDGGTSPRDRDEERTVLRDLAAGIVDLGWVGSRAVGATFGLQALDVFQAPLLFERLQDVVAVVSGELASEMLEPLEAAGLTGLAVVAGELRRPFGLTRPLVASSDWRGLVIRTHNSLPGLAAIRALGATPVLRSAAELADVRPGSIDGLDLDETALRRRGYRGWLTTNVALWPRTVLLAANRNAFARLTGDEQQLLRAAAKRAAAVTGEGLLASAAAEEPLPNHVSCVAAAEEEIAALRRCVDVVHAELAADHRTAAALDAVTRACAGRRSRPAATSG